MRRRDREMPKEFALEIIDKCGYAVLSMIDQDAPYAVPISVARDGDTVYFHCAKEGRKTDILRSYPRVCLVFVGDVDLPLINSPPNTSQPSSQAMLGKF